MNILHSIKTTALVVVAMLSVSSAWGEVTEIATAEALTSALSSATTAEYKLTDDIAGDFVILSGANVTIDLNNHKVTNSSDDTFTVTSGGSLTIKGTGTVDNITNAKACIYNNGTCTLEGGTYTRSAEASNTPENSGGNSYYNILNHGTMTINEGVSVTSNGAFSSLIANGYYNYSASSDPRIGYVEGTNQAAPSLTINSGTFSGGVNTVKNDDNSTLTINGGTFSNTTQANVWNNNKVIITGGTFESSTEGVNALYNNNYNEGVNVVEATITGGTFNAPIVDTQKAKLDISGGTITKVVSEGTTTISGGTITTIEAAATANVAISGGEVNTITPTEGATIAISGGTFKQDVSAYCTEGYSIKQNGDGTYGVQDAHQAQIGETKYATLAAAVEAAETVAEIKVLTDIELVSTLTIPAGKTITLDLNGKKITSTATDAIDNNGTLTLKDSGEGGSIIGKYTIVAKSNSTTTIESGNYTSSEFTVSTDIKVTNATITINGGTFTATDNAVIAGDGTERDGSANTFNITGGTFNGNITSTGYIACGIYSPWNDNINVSGGTFNITNGAGIVARAGNVNVTGGTFVCSGNIEGKVGAKNQALPCAAIVFDKTDPAYPGITESSAVAITGGSFTSEVEAVQVLGTDETKRVVISNTETTTPTFSTPINLDYCANGFVPTQNADGTYGVTNEFILTDGEPIPLEEGKTITNVKATYTRTMPEGTTWGTVCVPFTLNPSELQANNITLYTFGEISGSTLTVKEAQGDQAPGTPLLFHSSSGVSVFSTENATVNTTALTPPTSGLIGTYTTTTISGTDLADTYFINDDKFHQAKVSLTVPAYRAYIKYSDTPASGSAKPSTLFINIEGQVNAIDATTFEDLGTVTGYYTPDGTRHTTPQPGLNIIRMSNGKTIKLIK